MVWSALGVLAVTIVIFAVWMWPRTEKEVA
jgi:hypothetical protein